MARARNIKPSLFKNEDLAECSAFARLLFAGLWTLADREGRLEDRPKRIKGELFCFDNLDAEPLLAELDKWKFIKRYEVNGIKVIQVVTFIAHQKPHATEKDSDLPDENGFLTVHERNQKGLVTGNCSTVPMDKTVKEQFFNSAKTEQKQLEHVSFLSDNALNPSSLNPESLIPHPEEDKSSIPESEKSDSDAEASKPEKQKAKKPKVEATDDALQNGCRSTWAAYATAYMARYGAAPIRNASVNAKVKQLVKRLGAEAPSVAEFFVNNVGEAFVVRNYHSIGMLLQGAEAYRTQWATGQTMTATRANQMDKSQSNFDAAGEAMAILRAKRGGASQ